MDSRISKYSEIYYKAAYFKKIAADICSLPKAPANDESNVSSTEDGNFQLCAQFTAETAQKIFDWIDGKIGSDNTTRETDQKAANYYTWSRDFRDSSANFLTQANNYLESTDQNKNVATLDSNFNVMMQAYSNLTQAGYLDDSWETENSQFEESKDLTTTECAMDYMAYYLNKSLNQEANSGSEPTLPLG